MRVIVLVLATLIYLFAFDYKLKPTKVTNDIWVFLGKNEPVTKENGGNIANSYWIKTKKHWVVFDTGPSYSYAKEAHAIMKQIANLPIKFVFNSHFHDDHWGGDAYYKELGIKIYATNEQVKEFPIGSSFRVLNIVGKNNLPKTKVVKIDKIVTKSFEMNIDGEIFKIIKIKYPAHAGEDFMLYLPKRGVLFTGDLLMSERLTSIRHGSVEEQGTGQQEV